MFRKIYASVGVFLFVLLLFPVIAKGASIDGKIKRAGAGEAQTRREQYRAEQKKAEDADSKRKNEDEFNAYYRSLEKIIETARDNPGADVQDIEKHLAATEKLAQEMPEINAALIKYKAYENSSEFMMLKEAIANAPGWRKQAVRKVLAFPTVRLEQIKGQKTGVSVVINKQIDEVKPHLALAARYDANDPEVKRLQAEFATLEKDIAGKVATTKWEGHRNAPANATALAAAGIKFFKGDRGWADKYTVLAVAIKGKWTVQKKNILGAPILYGIAVNVAVQKEEDKKQKQARVFDGTLITAEKEGVKAEPPFAGFYVGQNWMVNADSVK